jgi:hypothetical protein
MIGRLLHLQQRLDRVLGEAGTVCPTCGSTPRTRCWPVRFVDQDGQETLTPHCPDCVGSIIGRPDEPGEHEDEHEDQQYVYVRRIVLESAAEEAAALAAYEATFASISQPESPPPVDATDSPSAGLLNPPAPKRAPKPEPPTFIPGVRIVTHH